MAHVSSTLILLLEFDCLGDCYHVYPSALASGTADRDVEGDLDVDATGKVK